MQKRDVTVRVVGTQRQMPSGTAPRDLSEEDRTELVMSGVCSFQNGKYFVIYEEDDGEGHVTRNTVKIYQDWFEVTKKGAVCSHMVFRAGERNESWYDTPYGQFSVGLDVEEVRIVTSDSSFCGQPADRRTDREKEDILLRAEASYLLEMNGALTARCRVCVEAAGAIWENQSMTF